ncbi:hypothetical protein G6F22_022130 [Rhizopus arrhizus]|nr:hypothetical protein G6F22_022130 [Rhizopus arrhizus]
MAHHLEKIFAGELLPNRTDPHTSTLLSSPPDDTTTPPFDVNTCPIDLDSINEAIKPTSSTQGAWCGPLHYRDALSFN